MGIRKKITKRLPIIGRRIASRSQDTGSTAPPSSSVYTPPPRVPSEPPAPSHERGDVAVEDYINNVISQNAVVLFMKGTPYQPLCGFSSNAAGILSGYGDYKSVDVIADPEVRSGIKDFSRWPTIPQVYIGAEFVGGSDILRQTHESGDLESMIADARTSLDSAAGVDSPES